MIRRLAFLGVFLISCWLVVNVSASTLWIISGASLLALAVLVAAMYWKDCFVGPGTLIDDARAVKERLTSSSEEVDGNADEREDLEFAIDEAFEADGRRLPNKTGDARVVRLRGDD